MEPGQQFAIQGAAPRIETRPEFQIEIGGGPGEALTQVGERSDGLRGYGHGQLIIMTVMYCKPFKVRYRANRIRPFGIVSNHLINLINRQRNFKYQNPNDK
jgi:hypothetical protein